MFQVCRMTSWHLMCRQETGLFIKAISHERLCVKPCLYFCLALTLCRLLARLTARKKFYAYLAGYDIICLCSLNINKLQKEDKTIETVFTVTSLVHVFLYSLKV